MAIVANGGTFYQTRLVEQVQTVGNEIVAAYSVRAKKTINASSVAMEQIHTAMVDAVNAPAGTAHQASLDNVSVAGKTGTAQWGPKEKERTAAWFAGFVPAEHPQYAFAALYEGDVGSKVHGGSAAAPMIGKILRQIYGEKGGDRKRETGSRRKILRTNERATRSSSCIAERRTATRGRADGTGDGRRRRFAAPFPHTCGWLRLWTNESFPVRMPPS